MTDPLIDSLTAVVSDRPGDVPLRLHLAELLIADGRGTDAVPHLGIVLASEPTNERAAALMRSALGVPEAPAQVAPTAEAMAAPAATPQPAPSPPAPSPTAPTPTAPAPQKSAPASGSGADEATPASGSGADEATPASSNTPTQGGESQNFDWRSAEEQVGGPAPAFVNGAEPVYNEAPPAAEDVWDVEIATSTLADVGGMQDVKDRLNMAFLAPLRNPELRRLYGKSLKGGLMLYGPPGCGKTYIARALAGEIGASFINVTLTDILDQFIGNSEANLHSLFVTARKHAPVVLFLDEIDAIGQKRSQSTSAAWRGVTNQLLMEMDGIGADNEGVFILAATNTPWDVDPALRRPGRFDRSVAVLPPDAPARHSILYHYLKDRPMEGIDLGVLVRQTNGFTGADLAHLVDSAAEFAMMDSLRTGTVRMMTMQDFANALKQVRPSAGPWFSSARNIVEYGNRDGQYDDLAAYMKANKLL